MSKYNPMAGAFAALVLVFTLVLGSEGASAQSYAPSAERGVELLAELGLSADQKQKSTRLLATARKQAIRYRADIDIAAIDLAIELEKDLPLEATVAKLVDKISRVEGLWRHSRILTWVKIRKILTPEQRGELKQLRNRSGRNIVKTQGEFIDPLRAFDGRRARERNRRASNLRDPFAKGRTQGTTVAKPKLRGNLRVAAERPADIYIDGKYRGKTPMKLRVRAGKHRIRAVFADGSPPLQRRVNVVAEKDVRLYMRPQSAAPGATPKR